MDFNEVWRIAQDSYSCPTCSADRAEPCTGEGTQERIHAARVSGVQEAYRVGSKAAGLPVSPRREADPRRRLQPFCHPFIPGDHVDPECGALWMEHAWIDLGVTGLTICPTEPK